MNYFIIFKLQVGQTKYAYTFADKASRDDLKKQGVILWEKEVEQKNIHTKEEVEGYMEEFKKK